MMGGYAEDMRRLCGGYAFTRQYVRLCSQMLQFCMNAVYAEVMRRLCGSLGRINCSLCRDYAPVADVGGALQLYAEI